MFFLAPTINASCKFKGKEICEGAVTKEVGKIVQICEDGRLKYKKKSKVATPWPKAGGGRSLNCSFERFYKE